VALGSGLFFLAILSYPIFDKSSIKSSSTGSNACKTDFLQAFVGVFACALSPEIDYSIELVKI
jgi:hypothetical protein